VVGGLAHASSVTSARRTLVDDMIVNDDRTDADEIILIA